MAAGTTAANGRARPEYKFIHAQNILRPQLKFERKPDNSHRPWRPILTEKFFAKEPFRAGAVLPSAAHIRSLQTA